MGRFDSLLDKFKEKRKELVRRAASKAASAALEGTTKAAIGAVDSVGNAIEKAIFGDVVKSKQDEDEKADRASGPAPGATDPFAHLKERERAKAKVDEDVDAELQALKKKLAK